MARNEPTQGQDPRDADETAALRRRKTARLLVPLGVAGVAAATIGLVPALASSEDEPDLPAVSAEKLLAKLAGSEVETVSGTVKISTDLGLPGLLAGGVSEMGGSPFGPGAGGGGGGKDDRDSGKGDRSTADPKERLTTLLSGTHTVRVAADGPDRQKVSLIEDAAEYSVIHNGDELWAYDSESDQAFHAEVPDEAKDGKDGRSGKDSKGHKDGHKLPDGFPTTPKEAAQELLDGLDPSTSVTVDGTTTVAGQDAYKLRLAPKASGSTIDSVTIAVDADNGAPLKFTLAPKGGGKPVFDIGFSEVSFDKPDAKTFEFTPPKGTEVTEGDLGKEGRSGKDMKHRGGFESGLPGISAEDFNGGDLKVTGEGWASVVELKLPGGLLGGEKNADAKAEGLPEGFNPGALLKSFGDEVSGDFGSGTVVKSRLINVLITDDGKVYAGAVTKSALVEAANGK